MEGFSTGYVKGNNYSCDNVLNKMRNERREEEGRRERSRDIARLELKRAHFSEKWPNLSHKT